MEPQQATEGEDVKFEVALSKPDVPVKWMKGGKELKPSDKYEMIDDGNVHILVLHDVKPDEAASYSVKADKLESKADLKVEGISNSVYLEFC